MALLLNEARAYVNHGRWVTECPRDCGYAEGLDDGQFMLHCGECGHVCPVRWPDNAQEIWDELAKRPLPRTRNWFPSSHPLALQSHCPHGQTVEELRKESLEHAAEGTSEFWSTNYDGGEVV